MKFGVSFLSGRVARRVVGLFVIAALIPIAATALLAIYQVTDALTEQSDAALRETAKNYGQSLYERLSLSDANVREIAATLRTGATVAADDHRAKRFTTIAVIRESGQVTPVLGDHTRLPQLDVGDKNSLSKESHLSMALGSNREHRIFLSQPVDPAEPDSGTLLAELNLSSLWGNKETFPRGVDFCVYTDTGTMLHCSSPTPEAAIDALRKSMSASPTGKIRWAQFDDARLAGYWTLFLKAHFGSAGWTVVASRPEVEALAPLAAFNSIFPVVLIISLLVVTLLSFSQIRRIMIPLEKLILGTRRIANQEFDDPVEVTSGDEFEELATAMNQMANRLGKQFNTLSALSNVDRQILSSLDIDDVFEVVLRGIVKIAPCDGVALTVVDCDSQEKARTFFVDDESHESLTIERIQLHSNDLSSFLANRNGLTLSRTTPPKPYLRCLHRGGAQSFFALPIISKEAVVGIISLGFVDEASLEQETIDQIRDFAGRIAVAMSAAQREEQLYRQGHYDVLTGLPNRQLFMDRLSQALAFARREEHAGALLYIDLDRFKNINDSLGHSAGDILLEKAAERLSNCVREVDTVARLGGDEFTLILPQISSPSDADRIATDIIREFAHPFVIDSNQYVVSASIGVTVFPNDGASTEDLLRNADTAMYRAKEAGRGCRVFFKEEMNASALQRMRLESDLRLAIGRQELQVFYQPQIELKTGKVVGAEALLRWKHAELGWIPPNDFIPLAEETGLICPVGEWVLATVCDQYARWQNDGVAPQQIAVNISAQQLHQPDFLGTVRKTLAERGVSPQSLELEITESQLIEQVEETIAVFDQLSAMGIRLSIDDFGTGYASLSYLKRFAFDSLKIDREFMKEVPDDAEACALARAIIAMAHSLGRTVIAEGVETLEQLEFLRENGCELAQGYYFRRPVPADEFIQILQEPSIEAATN